MTTVAITGTVILPDNIPAAFVRLTFVRRQPGVAPWDGQAVANAAVEVTTGAAGAVSFELVPGSYVATAHLPAGPLRFGFTARDQDSMDFIDGLVPVDVPVPHPTLQLAELARLGAEQAEAAAEASRIEAALYDGPKVDTFAGLAAVTPAMVAVGGLIRVIETGWVYQRVSSGGDLDYSGSGGVILTALPGKDGWLSFEQLGAAGDNVTNDRPAFLRAAVEGRKVRATPGKTYFVLITALAESIAINSAVHWRFYGAKVRHTFFGGACFWFPEGTQDQVIEDIHVVFDGTAPTTLPYTQGEQRAVYGGPAGGAPGRCCHLLLVGAENVTIKRPRFSAAVPGVRKSQYACIRQYPRADGSRVAVTTIESMHCDDYVHGFLGSGSVLMRMPGFHYFGRYDEYSGGVMTWGAPGHAIYVSGENADGGSAIDRLELGDGFDEGFYQGTTPGEGGFNAWKFRRVGSAVGGKLTSFRPHGSFDGFGIRNAYFDAVYFRNLASATDDPRWNARAFRIASDPGADTISRDITLGAVILELGANSDSPFGILGADVHGVIHERIRIKYLSLSMDVTNLLAPLIEFQDCSNCSIEDGVLNLSGTTLNGIVRFQGNSSNNFVRLRSIGSFKGNRVSGSSVAGGNYAQIDTGPAGSYYTFDEISRVATNGVVVAGAPASVTSSKMPRSNNITSGDSAVTLPGRGIYLVTVTAEATVNSGSTQNRIRTWLVHWSPVNNVATATSISESTTGAEITALTGAVSSGGVFTASVTVSTTRSIDWKWNVARIGVLP
jgi:hypothetical protein